MLGFILLSHFVGTANLSDLIKTNYTLSIWPCGGGGYIHFHLNCTCAQYGSKIWLELIRCLFNIKANWLFNFDEALNVLCRFVSRWPPNRLDYAVRQIKSQHSIKTLNHIYIASLKLSTRKLFIDFYLKASPFQSIERAVLIAIIGIFWCRYNSRRFNVEMQCILKESIREISFCKLTLAVESFKIEFEYTLNMICHTSDTVN